jgi:hypothetical protein
MNELENVIEDNYYGVGATGAEALYNMVEEYREGLLDEFMTEQGINSAEFLGIMNRLAVRWASEGRLHKMRNEL